MTRGRSLSACLVALYPGPPSVSDETNRGALDGQREESVTYVFEEPGEVAIPEIVLSWWDIEGERLRRIELPGLELEVVGEMPPPPAVEEETVAPIARSKDRRLLFATLTVFVFLVLWLGRRFVRRFREWRQARMESEAAYFRQLNTALRGGDSLAITSAVMQWLDRLESEVRPARLDLFLDRHGDDETRSATTLLARSVATGERFTGTRSLGSGLKRARRHYRQTRRHIEKAATVLPELNVTRP